MTVQPVELVAATDPLFLESLQVLTAEALLLDDLDFPAWTAMLDDDLDYRAQVRSTLERGNGAGFSPDMFHFEDNRASIEMRIRRLATDSAWAEDPPSRTRRLVTNVRTERPSGDEEVGVRSYLLLLRNRYDSPTYQMLSCDRHDLWLRRPDGWKLRRRSIYLDQTVVGFDNLAVFL